MPVRFAIDSLFYQVGHGKDFLHSFFSTISYHLEPSGWGTRYPYLLNHLYNGKLNWNNVPNVITELEEIHSELERFEPTSVIWDIENINVKPPWFEKLNSDIKNLANCFVTSEGRNLFEVMLNALHNSIFESDLETA